MSVFSRSRCRGVLLHAVNRQFRRVALVRTSCPFPGQDQFGGLSLVACRWHAGGAFRTYGTTNDGASFVSDVVGEKLVNIPKYDLEDFTRMKFQQIKNDHAQLEHFRNALQARLPTLDFGEERENLAVLNGLVEDQLEHWRKNEVDSQPMKAKNHQPSDIITDGETYQAIKYSLEELELLRSRIEILGNSSDIRTILLEGRKKRRLDNAKAFVDKLMKTKIELIEGSDMRVMREISDLETACSYNLIIRNVTEPFWQACIDEVDTPNHKYRVCAVGSPGIGKTLTTPFLIRMLLRRGKTVVYHPRTTHDEHGWLYEFTPITANARSGFSDDADNKYEIKVAIYPEPYFEEIVESLMDPLTYYVVDPRKSQASCDPDADFQAKVIIVASPDSKHWGGEEFEKKRLGVMGKFKYYPLWTYDELLVAGPLIVDEKIEVSEDVISERYRYFGGVPRRIFVSQTEFISLQAKITTSVALLTAEQTEKIIRKQYADVETKESSQPRGFVIGYKSEGPTFSEPTIIIMCDFVEEEVYSQHMKKLWRTMLDLEKDGGGAFEAYMRHVISKGGIELSLQKLFLPNKMKASQTSIRFNGCKAIRVVCDPLEAVKENAGILFYSANGNFPLIDFIYQDLTGHVHAFQATLATKHDASIDEIRNLEYKFGAEKLSLYYLVTPRNFNQFRVNLLKGKSDSISCAVYKVEVPNPNHEKAGHIFLRFMRKTTDALRSLWK